MDYPQKDFLRDFETWKTKDVYLSGPDRAKRLFSIQYPNRKIFAYRFNRFVCVMQAIHGELPALIQDRVALPDGGNKGGGFVSEDLLLALHEWYCSRSERQMKAMPDPDWGAVLAIYDRIDATDHGA
jgi:hypothetical protein